uniref:RNA-directed RNA polymerase n=1 Tax=Ousland virus TaxID=2707249 RepID=A0A6H0DH44_9VIRU|nr:MAG: RNA-dependent RNA polymerase [Ousland virus]
MTIGTEKADANLNVGHSCPTDSRVRTNLTSDFVGPWPPKFYRPLTRVKRDNTRAGKVDADRICAQARKCAAQMGDSLTRYPIEGPERFISQGFLKKYFDYESPIDSSALARKAETEWMVYDSALRYEFFPGIGLIRDKLHSWLKDWKPSAAVEFTPGEHELASRGQTSVEAKLARAWSCTPEAFDRFARVAFNSRYLRRSAWRQIRNKYKVTRGEIREVARKISEMNPDLNRHQVYFRVFKTGLRGVVLDTRGSRFSTVFKNLEKRRPINIEPIGNLILQRQIAIGLRAVLKQLGNDLEIGQEVHRHRISDPSVATIDFSNASDSVVLELLRYLLPNSLYARLVESRSGMVYLPTYGWYPTKKISAMGNGFTFEVMTLILLATARVLDAKATVYGDDVVISNDAAPRFIEWCEKLGFAVNRDKTFVNSKMRESCGAFWHDDYGYVTRYDFNAIEDLRDVVLHANKALNVAENAEDDTLRSLFYKYWYELKSLVPNQLQGPPSGLKLEDRYLVDPNQEHREYHEDYQIGFTRQLMVEFRTKKRSETLCDVPPYLICKIGMYLNAGRRSDDLLRGRGELRYVRRRIYHHGMLSQRQSW